MVGIGFFAPLPLAMMMPFMAGQSMIMGDAFGKAYQYGKRKISSMTNEEFNKLTPEHLATQLQTDYLSMIPSLKASVKASTEFQSFIIQELAEIVKNIPEDLMKVIMGTNLVANADEGGGFLIPPAFGDAGATTQKQFQSNETDWLSVLKSLAQFLIGAKGGPVINTGFTGETEEEKKKADKAALDIIEEQNKPPPTTFKEPSASFIASFKAALKVMPITQLALMKIQSAKFQPWQNTAILFEYNQRIANQLTPKSTNPHAAVQATYKADVKSWIAVITDAKFFYATALKKPINLPQQKLTLAKLKGAQKHLLNYITIAKNKLPLKALANNDWNKQVWK